MIPNSIVKYRRALALKKIIPQCINHGFTDLIVINEDRKQPNGMLITHLPDGPTAHFKLTNIQVRFRSISIFLLLFKNILLKLE